MSYDAIFLNGVTVIAPDSGDVKYQGGSAVLELPAHLVRAAHGEHYHQELQYLALLKELVNKAEGGDEVGDIVVDGTNSDDAILVE